jgi:hypothetical protein
VVSRYRLRTVTRTVLVAFRPERGTMVTLTVQRPGRFATTRSLLIRQVFRADFGTLSLTRAPFAMVSPVHRAIRTALTVWPRRTVRPRRAHAGAGRVFDDGAGVGAGAGAVSGVLVGALLTVQVRVVVLALPAWSTARTWKV